MKREALSSVDAAWLHMDRPVNTADVVAVLRLDGSLTMARLRRMIEKRLLEHRRFRQRIVDSPLGRPAWEDDPEFSLERQLAFRRIGSEAAALESYVSAVASDPLDLRRPPWRIHLVHTGKSSAIVAKLHHCMADGFALVAVLLSLADEALRGGPLEAERTLPQAASKLWRRAVRLALSAPLLAASLGRMIALPSDPATALKRPLRGKRRVAWSNPFPLDAVKAAARDRAVTVNEILNAAFAGALRGWLRESGARVSHDVRALVPVNLRPASPVTTLGNEFGLVFLEVPVTSATPGERAERLHSRMKALKASADALVTYGVLWVLGRLPSFVERLINAFFTAKASLVVTNVPGPREALHLAGHRLQHVMFWVPHPASLGVGASILTYAGQVVAGVRADTAVMPYPRRLVRLFEAELRGLVPGISVPRRRRGRARRTTRRAAVPASSPLDAERSAPT